MYVQSFNTIEIQLLQEFATQNYTDGHTDTQADSSILQKRFVLRGHNDNFSQCVIL